MNKKIFAIIALTCGLSVSVHAVAQSYEVDSEGYDVFYLRGEKYGKDWNCYPEYRFNRVGNRYTLYVADLDGQFKISNSDWSHNYGADFNADPYVTAGTVVTGAADGPNFNGSQISGVTITFDYVAPGSEHPDNCNIAFSTVDAPVVLPDIHDVYGVSGTLPVLYINVYDDNGNINDEIIDYNLPHKNYFSGTYWLDVNGCKWAEDAGYKSVGSEDEPLPLEIKARGNWTRKGFAKKPFKLKLGGKQSLLGLSKSKHYAIIAHADDNLGNLRNFAGFNLGHRMQLPWTPSQQPVEVVINGNYRGLYHLTESIRVGDGRVPITELDDNVSDPALISGGYLVELDNYEEENQIRMEEKGISPDFKDILRITFDTPEVYSDLQYRFVFDQFTAMNDAIGDNSDVLWSYIDMDDLARYYLVREITSDVESFHGSTYMFRDRGENQKWHFSPIWDCGNAFSGPTDGFFYDNDPFGNTWIPSIRLNDKFNEKVRETWKWFMSGCYEGIEADIRDYASRIAAAQKADRKRWEGVPAPDGGQPVSDNTDMESKVNAVLAHLNAKTQWLKGQFGDYSGNYSEPMRDATPAAPLPSYVQAGVKDVEYAGQIGLDAAEIYNLLGMRVDEMQAGHLYIVVDANGASHKVIR